MQRASDSHPARIPLGFGGARSRDEEAKRWTGYAINWGPVFASGVVIVLPVALAAAGLQRYIVRGLTLGAFR